MPDTLENRIKQLAHDAGFDVCGIASVDEVEDENKQLLTNWIDEGCAGEMNYMKNNIDLRFNPKNILPSAQSMIMVLLNYYPREWQPKEQPQIASYAYGADYHYVIKCMLRDLAESVNEIAPHEYALFTDSAPVMERYWAVKAGLGWIGRSGMLVNPRLGTFTFIGTLITSLQLAPDSPIESKCGNCRRCVDACPTGAILDNRTIDARKCISYLTIEKRGDIDEGLTQIIGNRLYGCDECQLACPWNRFAKPNNVTQFSVNEELWHIDWPNLTRSEFKNKLKFSAMQRAGYKKLRNRAEQISNNKE